MKKVMFVCTGNTCRSPMAEVIAKKLWQDKAEVISRGFCKGGEPMSENSAMALKDSGFEVTGHFSAPVTMEELLKCDLVLTMSNSHKEAILNACPEIGNKVFTLGEYSGEEGDIPDPFMQDIQVYKACCNKIYNCIKNIDIDKI